jgi:hypothetical protein
VAIRPLFGELSLEGPLHQIGELLSTGTTLSKAVLGDSRREIAEELEAAAHALGASLRSECVDQERHR